MKGYCYDGVGLLQHPASAAQSGCCHSNGKVPNGICCVKNLPRAVYSWQQKSFLFHCTLDGARFIIDTIFNFVARNITLTFIRSPFITNISGDVDDLKRRKESVFNAFFQAISIDWITKVCNVGKNLGLSRILCKRSPRV